MATIAANPELITVGEMPEGQPLMTREKDRACYRHQLVQIDLTFVKQLVRLPSYSVKPKLILTE